LNREKMGPNGRVEGAGKRGDLELPSAVSKAGYVTGGKIRAAPDNVKGRELKLDKKEGKTRHPQLGSRQE